MTDRSTIERDMTRQQAFRDTVCRDRPMGAARIVRREKYAWPGGYPLALLTHDGEYLCSDCVASEFAQISYAHRHGLRDGWRPIGMDVLEEAIDSDITCAHCSKTLLEQTD